MSPLSLKRLFAGKGKSQLQLSALCIGEYSRLTEQIPANHNYHELESLLAPERGQGEGPVGPASQASPVPKSSGLGSAQSFRGLQSFKHLLQHLGGASREGGPAPQAEGEAQQQLAQFVKQLGGGASEVSFVTAAEDGLLSRERVLAKLTKLFKQSAAPVVLVAYSGPSDERGNWCFAGQASASGASGSASAAGSLPYSGSHGAPGSPTTGGGAVSSSVSSCVVSFREVSMLWQRHRKHSQRLVLLLDCANSGYWVSALRLLSKAEQLELSLGVQASDCSAPAVADRQLTYMPGIFTQLFLSNNKWRRAPRPSAAAEHPGQGQGQDQQQAAGAAPGPAGGGNGGGGNGGGGGRAAERWLPGMLPSYYATWLNDSLVDYGIALRFFNCNVMAAASHTRASLVTEPSSPVTLASGGARRASSIIMMAAAEGAAGLARPSRQDDAALMAAKAAPHSATDGGVEGVWSPFRHADTDHLEQQQQREQRRGGAGAGAGGETGSGSGLLNAGGELVGPADSPEGADRDASRAAMSMRAVSVPDAARRRFSSLADYYVSSSGSGSGTGTSAAAGVAAAANSPIHSAHNQLHGSATATGIVASHPSQQQPRPPGADVRAASSGSGIGYIMLQRLLGSPSKSQSQVNARSGGSGSGGDGAGGGAPSEPGVGQLHPGQLGMPQQDLMADSPGHSTSMHGAMLPGEHLVHMSSPASAEAGGAGAGAGMAAGRPLQRRAASGDAAHVGVAAAAPRFGADSMPHILESEPADARGDGGGVGGAGGVRQQPAQAWTEQQQQQQPRARSGAAGAAEAGQGYALGAAADAARRAGAAVRPWEVEIEVEAEDVEDAEAGGYEAGGGAAAGTGASGVDSGVGMAVQASARSDTAAVAWGRRSTRADRDLLLAELDQRNAGSTASFTAGGGGGAVGGGGGGGGGFVNQLYGALHEVATEQRLWGRRAPLEGDESMGDMMRDVELDRRASNASLPSFMLPRAELLSTGTHGAVAVAGGGAAGGAGSAGAEDAERGAANDLAIPLSSTNITATLAASGGGGGKAGTRAPVATPRMSGLGALGAAGAGGVGSGSSGGGPALSGRPSINTPRQASRLFMTSLANVHAAAGGHDGGGGGNASSLASGLLMTDPEMELAMEAAAAAAGGNDRFELMSGNVPPATDPAALSALVAAAIGGSARPRAQTSAAVEGMLRQVQETQAVAGGGFNDAGGASLGVQGSANDGGSPGLSGGGGGGGGLFDAAMHILVKQAEALVSALPEEMAELAALASPAGAGGAGSSGRARPGTPSALAVDSPQPCASPTLSPMTSGIERRRVRASGAGALQSRDSGPLGLGPAPAASVMLRSLLKQHVSIADSMELDSVLGGSPSAVGGGGGGDGGGRRAGRFEMAGSESSSFVFGDDRDRFEVLRMMRDYQGDLADDGGGGGGGDTDTDMGGGGDGDGDGGSDCPLPPTRSRARRGGDEDGGDGGDGEEGDEEEDGQFEDEDDAAAADAERFRQAAAEARAAAAAALAAEEGQGQGQPHGSGPPPPSNRGGEMRVYGSLGAAAAGQGEEQPQQQQQQRHGDGGMAVGVREAAAQVAAVAAMLQGDESAQYGYTGESGSLLTADMEAAALSEGPPAP